MGAHFYVSVCGCDHAPFSCGLVCKSVSWSMYVPLCGHVAELVDDIVSPVSVSVDERLLMCVAVSECLVIGGVTLP